MTPGFWSRRPEKMHAEERLKAGIVAEALAKKTRGHLADARWPDGRWRNVARVSDWLVWLTDNQRTGALGCAAPYDRPSHMRLDAAAASGLNSIAYRGANVRSKT